MLRRLPSRVPPAHEADERFTLLGRRVPDTWFLRFALLDPGSEHAYRPAEWRGALVVVELGAITLITVHRQHRPLTCGAVLWLSGLSLRAIANPHREAALLSVLSRRGAESRVEV